MPSNAHGTLHSWSLPIGVTTLLIAVALVYLRGWYRLRSALPKVLYAWQVAAFMTGAFGLWAAVGSPLAVLDHQLLTIHMVQHLLLMTVAAPLMLVGASWATLQHGLPEPLVKWMARPLLRSSPMHKFGGFVVHPVSCWLAATAVVIGWHIPALFELGLRSPQWHANEQMSFFIAGLLFWRPVIRPRPSRAQRGPWIVPLYLFLATLPCDALSAFLTFCNRVVYAHYLSSSPVFPISPLGDQECAGALMWVWVTFAYLAPATGLTIRMLSPSGEGALRATGPTTEVRTP